jgi:predicted nucleic acid-binding Zn ribbon protein
MKNNPPQHISEVINLYIKKRHWTQRIEGYNIFDLWEDLLPEKIVLNAKPIKIQDHNLFIRVKNHVWANEIRLRKGEVINALNKNAGNKLIENLVIRIDTKYFDKKNK